MNSGNSSRHGVHHDAQKFTMTGRPRYWARSTVEPSRAVPVIAGTGSPVFAVDVPEPHAATRRTSAASRAEVVRRRATLDVTETYWAVMDPVMLGWIEQTKPYAPAGSAGTS